MTALETVALVRMALDEARDDFANIDVINKFVNEAQLNFIKNAYIKGDERALRPLYRKVKNLANGDAINLDVMYPRSCRIRKNGDRDESVDANNRSQDIAATFIKPSRFFNYVEALSGAPTFTGFKQALGGDAFPRAAYYTIRQEYNPTTSSYDWRVYFNADGLANALVVIVPPSFEYIDQATGTPLSVPEEYHTAIALDAAERINDLDVDETVRGDVKYYPQKLTIEAAGK